MKTNTKTILLFIMSIALITIIGVSYAYFTTAIVNNEVKDQVVTTGTLSLRYVDGSEIVMQNIKPGATITKTVYVANTGTLDAVYNLIWQELTNEITNDEMLIEGTCTRINSTTEEVDGTCEGITSTAIVSNTIKGKVTIEPNTIHKYDLTITFEETSADQNYNQGKKFSGVLGIEESKNTQFGNDSWETIVTNVRNGNILNYNLGDTKEVDLGELGKHNVRIANTSTPDECFNDEFSQTACGFVLEFEDIIGSEVTNMCSSTSDIGWTQSNAYQYINDTIYNALPEDLKEIIVDTIVVSGNGQNNEISTSTDKLYLLAPGEIYGDWSNCNSDPSNSWDTSKDLTRQLDYYKSKGTSISNSESYKFAIKNNIDDSSWWLRTVYSTSGHYYSIDNYGDIDEDGCAARGNGISPAFRIG